MALSDKELYFNKIYGESHKAVITQITAKCCNTEDINDIFQETYAELYNVIDSKGIDYIRNPEAFLRKIVKQKIYKHYSAAQRLKMHISIIQVNKNGEEFDISDTVIDEISLEESYILDEKIDEIRKFLKKKSVLTQKIFHLFYSLDKTIPEISQLLGVSQSNIKNHIYRTIKEVREEFTEGEKVVSYENK